MCVFTKRACCLYPSPLKLRGCWLRLFNPTIESILLGASLSCCRRAPSSVLGITTPMFLTFFREEKMKINALIIRFILIAPFLNFFFLLLCFYFVFYSDSSEASPSDKAGLSGDISILGVFTSNNSNLSTSQNERRNGALNLHGEQQQKGFGGLLGNFAFTFGSQLDKKFFAGTSREDIAIGTLALEIGYQQKWAFGTLSFSYLPTLLGENVWADPFLIHASKEETEKSGHAYRFQFERLANSPLSFELAYSKIDIEIEKSGHAFEIPLSRQETLKRDGEIYYAKTSYRQFLDDGLGVTPSIIYLENRAQGDAMAYKSLGGQLSYFRFVGRNKMILTASYFERDYKSLHPVFNQIRADREYSLFAALSYSDFLGIKPLSFISLSGFKQIESNVDFYEEKQYMASLGVNYIF